MNFKDAFTPAPEEFHQNLVNTLTSLEEGKKMKKTMIRSPLIAAAVIILIVGTAFAASINPATDLTATTGYPNVSAPAPTEQNTSVFAEKAGDIITFGSYEQDNNLENGAEPIEWLVLDIQDGRALVISKYGLDTQPIHNTHEEATWETCDLRAWLNGEFMDIAFTDAEQAKIPTVTVVAHADTNMAGEYDLSDVDPGNDTEDQIFVISSEEYLNLNYFPGKDFRQCKATAYAIAKGAWVYDADIVNPEFTEARLTIERQNNGSCFWWFRSNGVVPGSFAFASYNGTKAYFLSDDVEHTKSMFAHQPDYAGAVCVRPAMWIELDTSTEAADEMPVVTIPSTETTNFSENVGDIITFGSYEQDNNLENGAEPIEWLILDIQDGRALVISKYGLDTQPIHNTHEEATWETCDLRAWLNGEFMEIAFTEAEQARIPTVTVVAHKDPNAYDISSLIPADIDPGNDTEDQVFVLSAAEYTYSQYFAGAAPRKCKATAYAIAKGAWVHDGETEYLTLPDPGLGTNTDDYGYCFWWLRSHGVVQGSFAYASPEGTYLLSDDLEHTSEVFAYRTSRKGAVCVRPAMWIELDTSTEAADEMPTDVAPTPSPVPVSSIRDVVEEPVLVSVLPPENIGFSDVQSINDLMKHGTQIKGTNIETTAADEWENILFYIADTIVASDSHLIDSVFIASVHRTTGELKITEISNEMAITLPNIGIFTLKTLYEFDPGYILVGVVNRAFSMNIVDYFGFIPSDLAEGTPTPETGEEYFLTALKHWKNSGSLTGIEFDALLKRIEASEITEVQHLSLPLEGTYSSENGFNIINVDYEANAAALNEFIYGTADPFADHPLLAYAYGPRPTPTPVPANPNLP